VGLSLAALGLVALMAWALRQRQRSSVTTMAA
jgi:hypothetical protein